MNVPLCGEEELPLLWRIGSKKNPHSSFVLACTGVIPWEQPSMAPAARSLPLVCSHSVCTPLFPWGFLPLSLNA